MFVRNSTEISDEESKIIYYARKSLLLDKNEPWVKKNNCSTFNVTMRSFGGAGVCELVGLLILVKLGNNYNSEDIGLYRDDWFSVFKYNGGSESERIKKNIIKIFKEL